MTPSEKYLIPHNTFGNLNFDEYCSKIPTFYFKSEVPDDVIKNFEVVEKLLALSYFEYKLIDEAFAKAIHTFEMAMSIRLKDFEPKSKKQKFNSLITKLYTRKLFDTNLATIKYIQFLRNYYAHPERHSFGGIALWGKIEFLPRLINEMYEDVSLRIEREVLKQQFLSQQKNKNLEHFLVMEVDEEITIIFRLELLFINNKQNPLHYLCYYVPLFDLTTEHDNDAIVPELFEIRIANISFAQDALVGEILPERKKVSFRSIHQCPRQTTQFASWYSQFTGKKNKNLYLSGIKFNIPHILVPEIEAFQKM